MVRKSYNDIIYELVNERMEFFGVSEISDEIFNILLKLTPDKVYKNLIYMNCKSNIGIFALTYQKNLLYNIKNKLSCFELIHECKTPEYDNNKYLTIEEYNCIQSEIKKEMCVLNFYVDKLIHNSKTNIDNCYNCICDNIFINSVNSKIWIVDNYVAYNFNIMELISLIYSNSNNPATGKKFSVYLKESINIKYQIYFKLIQIYNEN